MKKGKDLSQLGGLVFSTHPQEVLPSADAPAEAIALPPQQQDLRITLDKKLKGGKVATVVYAFQGPEAELQELGKTLKTACGVGGAVKNGEIILQGNHLQRVQQELRRLGYRFKLAGV